MTTNHDQRSAGQINQWCADSAQSVTFTRQLLHASQGRGVILALLVGVLSAITTAGHAWAEDHFFRVPSDPVQEAKDNFAAGKYEFATIQFPDHQEMPGMKDAQQQVIATQYSAQPLNYRWKTYSNVEDDPQRLLNMRRYANRYNLMLWKLLNTKKQDDTFRYRY